MSTKNQQKSQSQTQTQTQTQTKTNKNTQISNFALVMGAGWWWTGW